MQFCFERTIVAPELDAGVVNQYLPFESLGLNSGVEFPCFRVAGVRGENAYSRDGSGNNYFLDAFYPARIIIGVTPELGVEEDTAKALNEKLAQYMQHIGLALQLWEHPNELAWLQQQLVYGERIAEIFAKTGGAIGSGFAAINAGLLYDHSARIIPPQYLQMYAIHLFATAGAFGALYMQRIYQDVIAEVYQRYNSRLQKLKPPIVK